MLRRIGLLPWLVLAVSLGLTQALWEDARRDSAVELEKGFQLRMLDAQTRIDQRMQTYEQILRGAVGLFAASGEPSRRQFQAYISALGLEENYPGIQAVGYVRIVPAAEKDRHLAEVRGEGFPDYAIHPDGERSVYTSVVYIEPFSGRNPRVLGYDMWMEPQRRSAAEKARDSARAALTGKVMLRQDAPGEAKAGAVMFLPVYRNGAPPAGVAARHAEVTGWVFGTFRIEDLMRGVLGERADDLDIEVYEGETTAPESLMYDRVAATRAVEPATGPGALSHVAVAGRVWTLALTSVASTDPRLPAERSEVIRVGGVCGSLLLAILTGSLVYGRRRAIEDAREIRDLNAGLESRVAERTAALGAALREMEDFSYSIAHDLRAPVRAINGFTSVLEQRSAAGLDGEGRRLLEAVKQSSLRMGRLIDDLLEFSRVGHAPLHREVVDMTALARRVLAECVPAAERTRVEIRLGELPPAHADPRLVEVALGNLVSNAIKFSAPVEHPVVEVGSCQTDGAVEYFVRDNGVGFNPVYAHKLFGVFQRLHDAREFEGTGIGLALVHKIVERHGGSVRGESQVGGGATFFFSLGEFRQGG